MLLKDFYVLESLIQLETGKYVAEIKINSAHDIFKGHFPGNPVTPGVCMMQIIKEITEHILSQRLQMIKSSNVKFMALINPQIHANLRLEIEILTQEDLSFKVKNTTYFEDTVALKLVCVYKNK